MAGQGGATHARLGAVHSSAAAQPRQTLQFIHQLPLQLGHQRPWGNAFCNTDVNLQVTRNNAASQVPAPSLDLGPIAAQLEFIISYFADRGQQLSLSEALQVAIELKAQEANDDARQRFLLQQRQQQQAANSQEYTAQVDRQFRGMPSILPCTMPSSASSSTPVDMNLLPQMRGLVGGTQTPTSPLLRSDLCLSGHGGNATTPMGSPSHNFASGASPQQMAISNAALSSVKMGTSGLQGRPVEQNSILRSVSHSSPFVTPNQPSLSGSVQDANLYNLLNGAERDSSTPQQCTLVDDPQRKTFSDHGSFVTASSDHAPGMQSLEQLGSPPSASFSNMALGTGGPGSMLVNLPSTQQQSGPHSALAAMAKSFKYTPLTVPGSSALQMGTYFPSSTPSLSSQDKSPLSHNNHTLPPVRSSTSGGSPCSGVSSLSGLVSYSAAQSSVDHLQSGYGSHGMAVPASLEGQGAASATGEQPQQQLMGSVVPGTMDSGLSSRSLFRVSSMPNQVRESQNSLPASPWLLPKAAASGIHESRDSVKVEAGLASASEEPSAWEQFLRESFPDQPAVEPEQSMLTAEMPMAELRVPMGCQMGHETSPKNTGVVKRCASLPSLVSLGRTGEKEGRTMRGAAAREDMGGECFSRKVTLRAEAGMNQAEVRQMKVEQTELQHHDSETAAIGVAERMQVDVADCMPSMFDLGNETFASLGPVVDGVGELFDQVDCDGVVVDLSPLEMNGSPDSERSPMTMMLEESLLSGAISSHLGDEQLKGSEEVKIDDGVGCGLNVCCGDALRDVDMTASEHYGSGAKIDSANVDTTWRSDELSGENAGKRKRDAAEESSMVEPLLKKVAQSSTEGLPSLGTPGGGSKVTIGDAQVAANSTDGRKICQVEEGMRNEGLSPALQGGALGRPPTSDSQSRAVRQRCERIKEYMSTLQKLLPISKTDKLDTASLLLDSIEYVKYLQLQVRLLISKPAEGMEEGTGRESAGTAVDNILFKHYSEGLCVVPLACARRIPEFMSDTTPCTPLAPGMGRPSSACDVATGNHSIAAHETGIHGGNGSQFSAKRGRLVVEGLSPAAPGNEADSAGALRMANMNCSENPQSIDGSVSGTGRSHSSGVLRAQMGRPDGGGVGGKFSSAMERVCVDPSAIACEGHGGDCKIIEQRKTTEASSSALTVGVSGESKPSVSMLTSNRNGAGGNTCLTLADGTPAPPLSRTWISTSPRAGTSTMNLVSQFAATSSTVASLGATTQLTSRGPLVARLGSKQKPR